MAWNEERDYLAFLQAALENDPSLYGEMSPEKMEEFKRLVAWIEKVRKENPNATIDIPYSFED